MDLLARAAADDRLLAFGGHGLGDAVDAVGRDLGHVHLAALADAHTGEHKVHSLVKRDGEARHRGVRDGDFPAVLHFVEDRYDGST